MPPAQRPPGDGEAQLQLAVAFDSAPVGMAVTTDDGAFVQTNRALGELLGRDHTGLLGRCLEDLAARDADALTAGREEMLERGASRHTTQALLRHSDGHTVPVTLTCARVPATPTGPGYLVVHLQDATERQAAEAALTRQALHDPLTGLPNRQLLLDRLEQALTRLARERSSVAVLFADLNDFKLINDSYGHAVGDQVLVAVARRLQKLQRAGDTACRLGGDEFVVLCEGSGREQARSVASRIHRALRDPVVCTSDRASGGADAGELRVGVSAALGVAATSTPGTTAIELLTAADQAMYASKPR